MANWREKSDILTSRGSKIGVFPGESIKTTQNTGGGMMQC